MSYKVVDGVELMRMIRDNELSQEIQIIDINNQKWRYNGEELIAERKAYTDIVFANMTFKILSETEENDIDNMKELDEETAYQASYTMPSWTDKEKVIVKQQNKILRALKQINRKMEEK